MNIFEYLIKIKRINILKSELNNSNKSIDKLLTLIDKANPFDGGYKINILKIELQKEIICRNELREKLESL